MATLRGRHARSARRYGVTQQLGSSKADDLIERYLDQLVLELRGRAPAVRRILAEAEDHLREAVDQSVAAGVEPDEAARLAIHRFGSARVVARRFSRQAPFWSFVP